MILELVTINLPDFILSLLYLLYPRAGLKYRKYENTVWNKNHQNKL